MRSALALTIMFLLVLRVVKGIDFWTGLTGKFPIPGDTGFFPLPRTLWEAEEEGWCRPPEIDDGRLQVRCYQRDPTVCLAYDGKGYIAAIHLGIQEHDVKDNIQYFQTMPVFHESTRFNIKLFVVIVFIVDQDTIKSGGRDNLSDGTGNIIQIKYRDGLATIPVDEFTLSNTTLYKSTVCVDKMGDHYYYNIHDVPCDKFNPVFFILRNYKVIGYGVQTFGRPTTLGPRDWNEKIPIAGLTQGGYLSDCIVAKFVKYGLISTHFYFLTPEESTQIKCPTRSGQNI